MGTSGERQLSEVPFRGFYFLNETERHHLKNGEENAGGLRIYQGWSLPGECSQARRVKRLEGVCKGFLS